MKNLLRLFASLALFSAVPAFAQVQIVPSLIGPLPPLTVVCNPTGNIGYGALCTLGSGLSVANGVISATVVGGNQNPHYFYAGPSSGSAGPSLWRLQVAADLPLLSGLTAGTTLAGTECFAVTQTGSNVCETPAQVLAYVEANIPQTTYPGLPAGSTVNGNTDLMTNYSNTDAQVEKVSPNLVKFRSVSVASANTITPNCDSYDIQYMDDTATGGTGFTIANPSCTPVEGQIWRLHLQTTGVQAITYGSNIIASGTYSCPTSTSGASKTDWFLCMYDILLTKWDCVWEAPGF